MTIAAYIRVSNDDQTTDRQRELLAPLNPDIWYEDVGFSRDQTDRPAFQRMIRDAEAGKISKIYITELDRFGVRNSPQLMYFGFRLSEVGVDVLTASGELVNGEDDLSVIRSTIGAMTSRREQITKGERSASAKIRDARQFKFCGGRIAPGLDLVAIAKGEERYRVQITDGKYTRIRGEREVFDKMPAHDPDVDLYVRPGENTKYIIEIFRRYADRGISPQAIARWINEERIPGFWNYPVAKQTIYKLLQNPVYIGRPLANVRRGARFAEFSGGRIQPPGKGPIKDESDWIQPPADEPLYECLPQDLWDRTQLRIKQCSGRSTIARDGTDDMWLRPLLRCGGCGRTMRVSRGGRRKPGYACGSYLQDRTLTECRHYHVRHDVLMEYVRNWLQQSQAKLGRLQPCDVAFDTFMRAVAITDKMAELAGDENYATWIERQIRECGQLLADKEAELDKALEAYADLPAGLRARSKAKLMKLEAEINELKEKTTDLRRPLTEVYEEYSRIQRAVDTANDDLSIETLRQLVDHIVIHHEPVGKNRSKLVRVEFVVLGESNTPGRACLAQHLLPRVICA